MVLARQHKPAGRQKHRIQADYPEHVLRIAR